MVAPTAVQQSLLPQETLEVDHDALARCLQATAVALDIETETRWPGVGPEKDYGLSYCADVKLISLAWRSGPSSKEVQGTVLAAPYSQQVLDFLQQLVSGSAWVICHNAVFDMRGISKLTGGKVPENIWCTATMQRLLAPQDNYDLLSVASALGVGFTQAQADMKDKRKDLHNLPMQQVVEYALADSIVTLMIYEKQQDLVTDDQTYMLAEWECRAVQVYCQMTARGVKLNTEYVKQRILELSQVVKDASAKLRADGLLAPNSPVQRVKYIYEKKGIPKPDSDQNPDYYTPKGGLKTGTDVINALVKQFPEHAETLKDLVTYINADRLQATLQALLDHAARDGRIHSLVSISTQAGRRSASHPQVQNWDMEQMAGVVTGDDGVTLVEIDYSNAENWMAAMLAGDDNLAAACAAEDFHSAMAARYFGAAWGATSNDPAARKHLRFMGKSITFGTAYGMGPTKLAQRLGVSYDEAIRILNAKDTAFSFVAESKRIAQDRIRKDGYITLWTGRIVPANPEQAYVSWNYCCQGGVSEMLKRSIVKISETFQADGMRSRVALDMHDAVILEVAHEEWNDALLIAAHIMSGIMPKELNERTSPQIQWIAKPNLKENADKWGKFQWHPEQDQQGVVESATPSQIPVASQAATAESSRNFDVSVPNLEKTYRISQPGDWLTFLSDLFDVLDLELSREVTTCLPSRDAKSLIQRSQPIKVNLWNYSKVLTAWLSVAESCDSKALIGLTPDELRQETRRILLLSERLDRCADLLAQVGQQVEPSQEAE